MQIDSSKPIQNIELNFNNNHCLLSFKCIKEKITAVSFKALQFFANCYQAIYNIFRSEASIEQEKLTAFKASNIKLLDKFKKENPKHQKMLEYVFKSAEQHIDNQFLHILRSKK